MERAPTEDHSIYVTHPLDDNLVGTIAGDLENLAVKQGYDSAGIVNFADSFVQNLSYQAEQGEYPKYPVETLVDKGGDCEDTAILAAALLQATGYDAILLRLESPIEGEAGHMAVGVAIPGVSSGYSYSYGGETYYYLETTSAWPAGDMPPQAFSRYHGTSDAIYKLEPAPVLRFRRQMEYRVRRWWLRDASLGITVTVTNWGTADADSFYVLAVFEGSGNCAKSSAAYGLPYGCEISGVAVKGIVVPRGGGTLQVQIFSGGLEVEDWSTFVS